MDMLADRRNCHLEDTRDPTYFSKMMFTEVSYKDLNGDIYNNASLNLFDFQLLLLLCFMNCPKFIDYDR